MFHSRDWAAGRPKFGLRLLDPVRNKILIQLYIWFGEWGVIFIMVMINSNIFVSIAKVVEVNIIRTPIRRWLVPYRRSWGMITKILKLTSRLYTHIALDFPCWEPKFHMITLRETWPFVLKNSTFNSTVTLSSTNKCSHYTKFDL